MKVLTVVVPAYNVEQYLEKCLSSMIDGSIMDKLEVLIINDGSTDKTESIASFFCERYPNTFKLITKSNGGHGSVINRALKSAEGKYFRVLDADDWLDTQLNSQMIKILQKIDADVFLNDYKNVNMKTGETQEIKNIFLKPNKLYNLDKEIVFLPDIGLAQLIYKTSLLKDNNICLTENTFYEDYEYATFPFAFISSVMYVEKVIYHVLYANSNQSTAKKNMVKRLPHLEKISKSLIVFLENANLTDSKLLYCKKKASNITNSFFLIALLYEPNSKLGRTEAIKLKNYIIYHAPCLWNEIKKVYICFFLLNCLNIKEEKYEKIRAFFRRKKNV